jgi:hypothetical protein
MDWKFGEVVSEVGCEVVRDAGGLPNMENSLESFRKENLRKRATRIKSRCPRLLLHGKMNLPAAAAPRARTLGILSDLA